MDECEVCMTPTNVLTTVRFDDTIDVKYCQECLKAVFAAMIERWNAAIAANNAAVAEFMRSIGLDPAVFDG